MDSELELELASFVTQIIFVARSTDWDSKQEREIVSLINQILSEDGNDSMWTFEEKILYLKPKMEFRLLTYYVTYFMDLSPEWKFLLSIISQIIFLISSMDLDSETELISLIKGIISLFNSKPDSESELVSIITRLMITVDSDSEQTLESELLSLIRQLVSLKPKPELISLSRQTFSRFISLNWEPKPLICLYPQVKVEFEQGKFRVMEEEVYQWKSKKGECDIRKRFFLRSTEEDYFYCHDCNGEHHEEEYGKAPFEVKHPLHPKHSLKLVYCKWNFLSKKCYCCDEDVREVMYCCSVCDFAMNIACVQKPPPVLSIEHSKWHQHPLSLFPRHTSLTCDVCALTDSRCAFYICSACDFVVHQKCLSLPRVLRISRHPHRISFTSSFEQVDKSCGICRKKILNDYGSYSCIRDGCSYVTHSKCATQKNVWDGKDLEEEPEEIDEEVDDPFVRISDGIIQHFSHQQHHLRLDENTGRDYDENKQCQACITPIYFGNFYSCVKCDFILHEECASLSRKIFHATHPHLLRLAPVRGSDAVTDFNEGGCFACRLLGPFGFFYQCGKEECRGYKLNMQCATISEPLVHASHTHPLFLTSKPGDLGECSLCKLYDDETFNCIEDECDFSLCFKCATIPQKVRYKHDKHTLTLSYGEETGTRECWCEACEKIIEPKGGFYKCDEYCCVTIHIECVIGKDLYMKPGSSFVHFGRTLDVLPNNHHMSRPFCSNCKERCPYSTVFRSFEFTFCSLDCLKFW